MQQRVTRSREGIAGLGRLRARRWAIYIRMRAQVAAQAERADMLDEGRHCGWREPRMVVQVREKSIEHELGFAVPSQPQSTKRVVAVQPVTMEPFAHKRNAR